jgi:putative tricarboxylic transport membrane protein
MRREAGQLRTSGVLLLGVPIFLMLLLIPADGKAADPSAGYPSKPVEFVAHSAPGSSNDLIGRLMSDIIQKEKLLGQPLIVVNKIGSGGAVAQGYTYEKKGNPHVVMGVASSTFLVTPLLEKLPYTYKSFTPIANLTVDGSVMVVKADSPFKTADDVIAEARKRPKTLIQGGSSFTGNESLMGRSMQKKKGVEWNFISFAGGGLEALVQLLAGNVHFVWANPSQIIDHVRAGKMRVILAGAPTRYRQFKDAPTITEAGLGELIVVYRGIVGPPNMPDYAVKKIVEVFKKAMDSDRFKKFIDDVAQQPGWMPPQEFAKFLDEENERWKGWLSDLDLLKKK